MLKTWVMLGWLVRLVGYMSSGFTIYIYFLNLEGSFFSLSLPRDIISAPDDASCSNRVWKSRYGILIRRWGMEQGIG